MAKVLKQVKKQKKRENMGIQHCVFEEKQVPFSYVLIHYQVTKFMGIGGQHEIAVKMMWNVHELVLFYRFDSIKQKNYSSYVYRMSPKKYDNLIKNNKNSALHVNDISFIFRRRSTNKTADSLTKFASHYCMYNFVV